MELANETKSSKIKDYCIPLKLAALLHYIIDRPIEEPSQRVERLLDIDMEQNRLNSSIYDTEIIEIIKKHKLEDELEVARWR